MKKIFAVIFAIMIAAGLTTLAFAEGVEPAAPQSAGEVIADYWFLIVAAIVVLAVVIIYIVKFAKTPHSEQLEKIKGWLLWAVTQAEVEFGSKTGQLKLSCVYDLFVARFPWLAKIIPFAVFSEKVDEALVVMREMLAEDPDIPNRIPAGNITVEEIEIEKPAEAEKE